MAASFDHSTRARAFPKRLTYCVLLLFLLGSLSQGGAGQPAWWTSRGVIATDSASGNPLPADDYAYLNQGQLKNLAVAAYDEMQANLPGGAGAEASALIKSWFQIDADGNFVLDGQNKRIPLTAGVDAYAAVNLGQLKNVAQPFADRLITVGYWTARPWDLSTAPPADYAPANIGQAKNLFNFALWPASTVAALQAATLSAASLSGSQVLLGWNGTATSAGETLLLERKTPGGSYQSLGNFPTSGGFIDSTALASTVYTYRIRAAGQSGEVAFSGETSVATSNGDAVDLSGLRLWLDAETAVGTKVPVWSDLSGHNFSATQADAAQQPQVSAGVAGGRPALHFSGSSLALSSGVFQGLQGSEMLTVHRSAVSQYMGAVNGYHTLGSRGSAYYPYGGYVDDDFCSSSRHDATVSSPSIAQFHLYDVDSQNGEWTNRINGQVTSTTAANTFSPASSPRLGSNPESNGFAADIAEILIFDHVLTEAERATWSGYLNRKYQLVTPAAPANLTAQGLPDGRIAVQWAPAANAESYRLARKLANGEYTTLQGQLSAGQTLYFDTDVVPGTTYTYQVFAAALGAESPSNEASATPVGGLSKQNLVLWLRSDVGVKLDGSGLVAKWTDLSPAGSDATGTTNRPLVMASSVNNLPAVRFDGSASSLTFPATETFSGGITAFIVGRAHGAGTSQQLFSLNGVAVGGPYFGRSDDSSDLQMHLSNFSGDAVTAAHGFLTDTPQLWEYSQNDTDGEILVNGVSLARAAVAALGSASRPAPTHGYYVGGFAYNSSNPEVFQEDIAEVLLYRGRLSDTDRRAVEQYLAGRYALTPATLPAPENLQGRPTGPTEMALTWYFPSSFSGVEIALERRTGAGAFTEVGRFTDSGSTLDGGLSAGATYTYRTRAVGLNAVSPYSNEFTVTLPAGAPSAVPAAGLRLWLSARDLAGGPLATWPDLSGNSHDATQTSPAARPIVFADALNGHPAVHFDGSSSLLNLPASLTAGLSAGEIFIVQRSTLNQNDATSSTSNGGHHFGTSALPSYYPGSDSFIHDDFGSSIQHASGEPAPPLDSYHLYNVVSTPTEWTSRLDGVVQLSTPGDLVAFAADPMLGSQTAKAAFGITPYFGGEVAEVLMYDHALTPAERTSLQYYVSAKYGLLRAPALPENLVATASSPHLVRLEWDYPLDDSDASFSVERRTAGGAFAPVGTLAGAEVSFDEAVAPGTAYTYRVVGSTPGGLSDYSNEATVTTPLEGAVQWVQRELRVVAGRAGHAFFLEYNGIPVQSALASGLIEQSDGQGGYLAYTTIAAAVDIAHADACVLIDGLSGDRLSLAGIDPTAAVLDLTGAAWLDGNGQPAATQYFLVSSAHQGDQLALVTEPAGNAPADWYPATTSPFTGQISYSDFGAAGLGDRCEVAASFDTARGFHLVDLSTAPKQISPSQVTDLVPVAWADAGTLVVPPTSVTFIVNAADLGRVFTLTIGGVSTTYTAVSMSVNGQQVVGFVASVPMESAYTVTTANSTAVVSTGTGIGILATVDVSQSFLAPPPPIDPNAVVDTDGSIIGLQVFTPPL